MTRRQGATAPRTALGRVTLGLLGLLPFLLLATPSRAAAGLRVVTTVPDLAAIAKEVGGEHVQVQSMATHTQDPHFVDAKPNLALALSRADLLLLVGLELEVGWLPNLLTGARNAAIQPGAAGHLDCSQFVAVQEATSAPVDRSQGDIHPRGNPHYLYDPRSAAAVAQGVALRMAQLDPANAAHFQQAAQGFAVRMATAIGAWRERLARLRGAPVITYHRSWSYLAEWLGLHVVLEIEPKPGIPPSPAHIARVLDTATGGEVLMILQESYAPRRTPRMIADRAGLPLVLLPPATAFTAGQSYREHLDEVVDALARTMVDAP
jgi:zinc/manganese transport system substrate-binding protein